MTSIDDVCVVTQPLSSASAPHVRDILNIISAITTVSLLTANLPDGSSLRDDYEVINIASNGTGSSIIVAATRFLRNQLRMAYVLWQREESIVLFFGSTSYLVPIVAAKLSGKTVVLEPRGDVPLTLRLHWEQRVPKEVARLLAGIVGLLEWIGYWLSGAIITYTPSMADELGLDSFAEKVYPHGARYVDTETFYPRVPFAERESVVGFVGRLDEEKNVRLLATVAKQLPPEVQFRFVGDGELRAELERDLGEKINQGSVEFTGWVDHEEIPQELSELRLLVLPSEPTEGLPTVILEAMACGTPVLATPVAGVSDIVRKKETGFLCENISEDALQEWIEEVIQNESLDEHSDAAGKLIEEEFAFECAVRRYESILTEIATT